MIIRAIVKNKMLAAGFLLLFSVCVTVNCSCTCENDTGHDPQVLQGTPGKRGPPGPPGSVLQCGCNTSEVLESLENLSNQINSYNRKFVLVNVVDDNNFARSENHILLNCRLLYS